MSGQYLMEHEGEALRLEVKTDAEPVKRQAGAAGLCRGMRVADVCCGAGRTTAVLKELAGEEGTALGIDGSAERIEEAQRRFGSPGLSFVQRNILEPLDDLGAFDFVWARFILEYYKNEAFDIVKRISSLVAEGGILCLGDLDYNCLSHYGISPRLEAGVQSAMKQMEEKGNFDPFAGRKLYSHLYRLGYREIGASLEAHHLIYGELKDRDAFNWIKKIEVLSKKLRFSLPGYDKPEDFLEDFREFFHDPGRFTYTPLITCWGRKTESSDFKSPSRLR